MGGGSRAFGESFGPTSMVVGLVFGGLIMVRVPVEDLGFMALGFMVWAFSSDLGS